jgi:hypothetical protein
VDELLEFIGDTSSIPTKKKNKKSKKKKSKSKSALLVVNGENTLALEKSNNTMSNSRNDNVNSTEEENGDYSISDEEELVYSLQGSATQNSVENEQPELESEKQDEDDELDPEEKAALDKEVEEFRLRLESINNQNASSLTKIFESS